MKVHINEGELRLLAYLHEACGGCGENYRLNISRVAGHLGVEEKELRQQASFLVEHKLAGWGSPRASEYQLHKARQSGRTADLFPMIWITGWGANYIRSLEAEPTLPTKLTATVVRESWGIIKDVAGTLLAEVAMKMSGVKP